MPSITLLDLAKRKVADAEVGLIDETMKFIPEVSGMNLLTGQIVDNLGAAKAIKDTHYSTRVRTALPSVGFRAINEGTATTKQTTENRIVSCHLMNPRWDVDKGIGGFSPALMEELAENAQAHMQGAFQQAGKQFYYGTNTTYGGKASGFPGLIDSVTSAMTVDAGGSTANTGTSVWAVSWGIQGLRWVLGNDGAFNITDPREQDKLDGSSNPYTVLMQELFCWIGLQVGSTQCIARLKKVTNDSGCGVTTSRLRSLMKCFADVGRRPDAFYLTQRAHDTYVAHLESLSVAPEGAAINAYRGVPFIITNSISDTEALTL